MRLTARGVNVLAFTCVLLGAGVGVWLSPTRAAPVQGPYDTCIEAANGPNGYATEVCEPLLPSGCPRLGLNTFDCRRQTP